MDKVKTEPTLLQVSHEAELDLYVIAKYYKCIKVVKIKDIINIDDHVFIKVEPHNCEP